MTTALSALERLLLGMAAKMALQVLGSPERALADRALGLAADRRALFNFTTMVGAARSSCCFSFLRVRSFCGGLLFHDCLQIDWIAGGRR